MKSLWLLAKNALFTACVQGVVVGWVPLHWFERHAHWPADWGIAPWAGALLSLAGAVLYLHSQWQFFARGQGTPAPVDPPRRLVRRGAYRWVRNPMYLATAALVGGEALFLQSWHVAVYLVCLACLLHILVVVVEEEALRARFGALYEDYCRDVPRWWPRRPRPVAQTVSPFPPVG